MCFFTLPLAIALYASGCLKPRDGGVHTRVSTSETAPKAETANEDEGSDDEVSAASYEPSTFSHGPSSPPLKVAEQYALPLRTLQHSTAEVSPAQPPIELAPPSPSKLVPPIPVQSAPPSPSKPLPPTPVQSAPSSPSKLDAPVPVLQHEAEAAAAIGAAPVELAVECSAVMASPQLQALPPAAPLVSAATVEASTAEASTVESTAGHYWRVGGECGCASGGGAATASPQLAPTPPLVAPVLQPVHQLASHLELVLGRIGQEDVVARIDRAAITSLPVLHSLAATALTQLMAPAGGSTLIDPRRIHMRYLQRVPLQLVPVTELSHALWADAVHVSLLAESS